MRFVLLLLFLFAINSCNDDCDKDDVRCVDNAVELCDDEQNWEVFMDCSEVEPTDLNWICCEVPEGLTCLPSSECDGGVQ